MKYIITIILLIVAGVAAFIATNRSEPIVVSVVGPELLDTRCFAQKEYTDYGSGVEGYSYSFARFDIFSDMTVEGYLGYFPYGTDSSSGEYKGEFTPSEDLISGEYYYQAEGMNGVEERNIKLTDVGLLFGFGPLEENENGTYVYANEKFIEYDYPLPSVACKRYDAWYLELFGV